MDGGVRFAMPALQDENAGASGSAYPRTPSLGKGLGSRSFGTPLHNIQTPAGKGKQAATLGGKTPGTGLRPRRTLGDITNSVSKPSGLGGGKGGGFGGKGGGSVLKPIQAKTPASSWQTAAQLAVRAQGDEIARLAEEYARGPCEGISVTGEEVLAAARRAEDAEFARRAQRLAAGVRGGGSGVAAAQAQNALWDAVEDDELALALAQKELETVSLPEAPPLDDAPPALDIELDALDAPVLGADSLPDLPEIDIGPVAIDTEDCTHTQH